MKRTLLNTTHQRLLAYSIAAALSMGSTAYAVDYPVFNLVDNGTPLEDNGLGDIPNTLSWAILQANTISVDTADTIILQTDVKITGVMKTLLDSDINLQSDATPRTISGNNEVRPLFVKSGNITIKNLTLGYGQSKGGNSRDSGGGAGLGGALFVYDGEVLVEDVSFI